MRVESGLEVLVHRRRRVLHGRRVALVAHQPSIDSCLEHASTLLRDMPGARLVRLFAPEHGLWGAPQDHVAISAARDPVTRLPVVSLYGQRREPPPAMLHGLDAIVVDLQDVGARYYTYVWTTVLVMRAAGRVGVPVIVLDRPNPLGGEIVEGNLPDPAYASFVGLHPLPARHGLTIGEIVCWVALNHGVRCEVTVIPMRGWRRAMTWADTGLPWVAPSPNMPTPDTALVYPGGCLFEGTNLSEGRGTTRPFEWVGAPWLDAHRLAAALEAENLPGVRFRPTRFMPTFHKWAGRLCGGVQIHPTDPARFKPYLTALTVIAAARRLAPHRFRWRRPPYEFEYRLLPIDILCGTDEIRRAIERRHPMQAIERSWDAGLGDFRRRRSLVTLYR